MKVAQILKCKGPACLHGVAPGATVLEALTLMARHNIGVVLVMADEQLVGIFSERDYARKGVLSGRTAKDTRIAEVMTHHVMTVEPADSLEHCMKLMSEMHIRHLPAVEGSRVVGMVSVTDVITALLHDQTERVASLEHYIRGGPVYA